MQKFSTFFTSLFKSTTSPSYYNDILKAKFSFSVKYVALLYLFLTLVTLSSVFQFLFAFDAQKAIRSVSSLYPQDLEMKVTNGQFFINKPLPYTIAIPTEWKETIAENSEAATSPAMLVVFESDKNIKNVKDVQIYNTFALITESTAYFLSDTDTGEIRVYPIPQTDDSFELSRRVIDNVLVKITEMPLIKSRLYAPMIAIVFFLIAYPFGLIVAFISLAFVSLVPFLLSKLFFKKAALSYGNVYQMGMHAQTPLLLINSATERFMGYTLVPGFLYLIVFTAWLLALISQLKKHTAGHTVKKRKT